MAEQDSGGQYSTWVGLIYIFNLIVGTGALTLPAVFSRAGWLLGLVVILILAFISFVTVTFVIEAMASANAIVAWNETQLRKRICLAQNSNDSEVQQDVDGINSSNSDSEDTPLVAPLPINPERAEMPCRYYVINETIEMGEMANIFFNRFGTMLFYICLAVYLYGDLSIYGAAVAKSMIDVSCTFIPKNVTCNDTIPDDELCWQNSNFNRMDAYRMFLTSFVVLLGSFVFFNVQKTKYLQFLTSAMRWLAFTIMILYAVKKLIINGAKGNPSTVNLTGVPGLFGACVYSFMCHHSLPALVAPISNKSTLNRSLGLDYVLIAVFYLLLALTGAFAFEHVNDLYTLDFSPRGAGDCSGCSNIFVCGIEYFLALFPVFTLSTSFPIIAITLRNNLQALFSRIFGNYDPGFCRFFFPVLAVLPPYLIAMSTKDLTALVAFTGSYAGVGIQYLIPTFLVFYARCKTRRVIGLGATNTFASPFVGIYWLVFVVVWAIACMILVTVNLIEVHVKSVSMGD